MDIVRIVEKRSALASEISKLKSDIDSAKKNLEEKISILKDAEKRMVEINTEIESINSQLSEGGFIVESAKDKVDPQPAETYNGYIKKYNITEDVISDLDNIVCRVDEGDLVSVSSLKDYENLSRHCNYLVDNGYTVVDENGKDKTLVPEQWFTQLVKIFGDMEYNQIAGSRHKYFYRRVGHLGFFKIVAKIHAANKSLQLNEAELKKIIALCGIDPEIDTRSFNWSGKKGNHEYCLLRKGSRAKSLYRCSKSDDLPMEVVSKLLGFKNGASINDLAKLAPNEFIPRSLHPMIDVINKSSGVVRVKRVGSRLYHV